MKRKEKMTKYRDMTQNELSLELNDLKQELFNLRFQLATGQLENPLKVKSVKKDIARVSFVMREKELGA